MKKRKSPFAMIALLAIIFVVIVIVGARSHADPNSPGDQPAQAKQDDSKPPTAAPSAADLSKSLKSQVGTTKKTIKPKQPGQRSALENPFPAQSSNPQIKQKVDPTAGVQGGWYQKDSALNK